MEALRNLDLDMPGSSNNSKSGEFSSPEKEEDEEKDNEGILNFNKLITYNAPKSKKKLEASPAFDQYEQELNVFAEAKQLQSKADQK